MSNKRIFNLSVEELRAQSFIKKLKTSVKNPVNETTGVSNCFVKIPIQLYCSLAPCYLKNPLQGIQNQHLNPMIMKFQQEVNGVVLGYENLKFDDNHLQDDQETPIFKITPDSPFAFVWCTCELLVWCPHVGDVVEGWVFIQSASHIGLLIHDAFNASIKKNNIPESWSFIHDTDDSYNMNDEEEDAAIEENNEESNSNNENGNEEADSAESKNENSGNISKNSIMKDERSFMGKRSLGYWVDEDGSKIDGKIKFTIRNVYTSGKMISIDGTLLSEDQANSNNHNSNNLSFNNSKNKNPIESLPVVSNKKIVFDDEVSHENKESHKDLHLSKMEDNNGEEVMYEANESDSSEDSENSSSNDSDSSD